MGRTLLPESNFKGSVYSDPAFSRRREVLRETIAAFEEADSHDFYHRISIANLARWKESAAAENSLARDSRGIGIVIKGDWGDVTADLTKAHGEIFAVLSMANAYVPGGGYIEGCPAQEENMFRRTDCHFAVCENEVDPDTERYHPSTTSLINGEDGCVFLDAAHPRVCIRGAEDCKRDDLGYPWLPQEDVFPFYELRASAQDLRYGSPFNEDVARLKIAAQIDTLITHGVKHAVLGAFGCGAFLNPAVSGFQNL